MRALYVSQNGIAENLGQSQVLPYLRGLVRRGAEIDLVSFELPHLAAATCDEIAEDLSRSGIRWHPLSRKMRTPLSVKIKEAVRGVNAALLTAARRQPDIVHGRSYFATAICDAIRVVRPRAKLLFDCRGMIGDEYVDCGYWTEDRIEYRLVKTYERRLFKRSDGIVVLTRALAQWLAESGAVGPRPVVEVIPCCVDLEKFVPSDEARARLRRELGLNDELTILYAGSLGAWYLEQEMARFARLVRLRAEAVGRGTAFVCLTPSDPTQLHEALVREGFRDDALVFRKVAPKDMPAYLSIGDVGLSFIQSCFSKKGSSPTKVAEYLACGNAVVVNGDIGDQADLASEPDACVVIEDFTRSQMERAADKALALALLPRSKRVGSAVAVARRHFGLEEVGVERYIRLYESLASDKSARRAS